jgi:magnesium-transporting ATPase (P-type)
LLKAEAEAIIDFLILDVLLGIIYFIISSYLYVGEKTIIVMLTIFVVTVPIIIVVILKAILFIKNMISNEQEIKDIIFEIGRINDKLFFTNFLKILFNMMMIER